MMAVLALVIEDAHVEGDLVEKPDAPNLADESAGILTRELVSGCALAAS